MFSRAAPVHRVPPPSMRSLCGTAPRAMHTAHGTLGWNPECFRRDPLGDYNQLPLIHVDSKLPPTLRSISLNTYALLLNFFKTLLKLCQLTF